MPDTFSYDLGTLIGRVRLELDDTNEDAPLFSDEEIQAKLTENGDNVLKAAADLCDILARRYARDYDFKTDDQEFKRGARAKVWADLAEQLRNRAGGGLSVMAVTKVDGYSDDLSTRDGAGGVRRTGRVRRGYTDPDLPS